MSLKISDSLRERMRVDLEGALLEGHDRHAAIVLFDPLTGAYIGPKCAGDHPRPACIDPRCAIKSADHSAAVRRELERREAARKQREAERHDGPLVDTGPDDD